MSEESQWRLDDAAAEYYEANFVPAIFGRWAPLMVDGGGVTGNQRVLDVACGTGIVARVAAERLSGSGQVIGLDLNSSMIAVARRLGPEVEWREGDATQLPFSDAEFDVVLSQAGLMFFPDPVVVLREMHRVLRPGGRLALLVWGASAGYDLVAELLQESSGEEVAEIFRAPFCMADAAVVLDLLRKAGFASPVAETHEIPAVFSSVDSFLRTEIEGWVLKGQVDCEALLPIAEERLGEYVDAGGEVFIPMAGHVITCTR